MGLPVYTPPVSYIVKHTLMTKTNTLPGWCTIFFPFLVKLQFTEKIVMLHEVEDPPWDSSNAGISSHSQVAGYTVVIILPL